MNEFRNPFRNGTMMGANWDQRSYHEHNGVRGKPDFVITRSELMTFAACPQKWIRGVPSEETKQTEFGQLVDTIVLQPLKFFERWAVCPETYPDTKTGDPKPWTFQANFCKQWRDEAEKKGQAVVKADVNGEAHAAATRLTDDDVCAEFLSCCQRQVCVKAEYHDEETEIVVPVKILLDLVPFVKHPVYGKCLADLKTARSASERQWSNAVVEDGLHVQAAFYLDVYRAATGEDRNTFLHLIVENSPPYEPCRSFMTTEFLEFGRMEYLGALVRYCQCLKTGEWPSYNHAGNSWPSLPGWRKCDPPLWLAQRYGNE